jgi:serine protease Do
MGVTVQELDEKECDALKLDAAQGGLRVDAVQAGGAAEAAGIKAGDVILGVAGVTLPRTATRDRLRQVLVDVVKPGKEVEVIVLRNGDKFGLKATWKD